MGDSDDSILREASQAARALRFELTDEYVQLIEEVEALPENQPRADKTRRDPSGSSQRSLRSVGPLRAGRQ